MALRTPSTSPGYLTSASTQRSGFVTLVDLAPTMLDVLGIDRPTEMEGRPVEDVQSDASLADRIDQLISLNAASRFREQLLVPTTTALVVLTTLLAAVTVFVLASGRAAFLRRWLAAAALLALGGPAGLLPRPRPAARGPRHRVVLGRRAGWPSSRRRWRRSSAGGSRSPSSR